MESDPKITVFDLLGERRIITSKVFGVPHKVTLDLNVVGDRIYIGALRLVNQRHNEPNLEPTPPLRPLFRIGGK